MILDLSRKVHNYFAFQQVLSFYGTKGFNSILKRAFGWTLPMRAIYVTENCVLKCDAVYSSSNLFTMKGLIKLKNDLL
jgi:hypothetical protein